ncbi:unnamed protein product [Phytophthora fragariaefolia]|uniref:Unnamed protein product n=1 Tax=Phytophthora fragariaefolia TaxID=1490495 RepID=A0A9W6Y9F6_9STRA|nr:unnamed protein product [Phytophthora fragariaefolia]
MAKRRLHSCVHRVSAPEIQQQCHCVHADGKQLNCTGTESEGADILPRATLVEIRSCVDDTANDNVFLPVNFDTSHWVYLVDYKANKTRQLYDSLNKRKIAKVLKTLATEFVSGVLDREYEVTTLKTPRQKDGDSCGVFFVFASGVKCRAMSQMM